MMGRRPWTIKDDDHLRILAATGDTSGSIGVRLKRSAAAIRKRATYLGIVLAGSTKALGLKAEMRNGGRLFAGRWGPWDGRRQGTAHVPVL